MSTANRKWLLATALFGFALTVLDVSKLWATGDLQFFGDFCAPYTEHVGGPFGRTYDINFFIKSHADYRANPAGQDIVHGRGIAELTGHNMRDRMAERHGVRVGSKYPFVFAGRVTNPGRLVGSGQAPGRELISTVGTLSADGLELEMPIWGRTVRLRKDRCDNRAPSASIVLPTQPTEDWGAWIHFSATIEDIEDSSFPDWRQRWYSSRDGLLGTGRSISRNTLSTGTHIISFKVIDSGGLSATATKELTITNNPPRVHIIEPRASREYTAGAPIPFHGEVFDSERGNLTGTALVWTTDAGFLGSGHTFQTFMEPGDYRIRLNVADGELTGRDEVTITVGPRSPGNQKPGIVITSPQDLSAPVGDTGEEDCFTLTAIAEDLEDGLLEDGSITWKDHMDGTPLDEARILDQTGESIEACNFRTSGGDTLHTITATARDSEGAEAVDSIRIFVIGGGLF